MAIRLKTREIEEISGDPSSGKQQEGLEPKYFLTRTLANICRDFCEKACFCGAKYLPPHLSQRYDGQVIQSIRRAPSIFFK